MTPLASKRLTIGTYSSMINKVVKFTVGSSAFKGEYLGVWKGYHVVLLKGKKVLVRSVEWIS